MTASQSTTSPTTSTSKPTVRVKADGTVTCNCASYRAAFAMFGAGYCTHVRQLQAAQGK
jgi:hypothetical protein